MATPITKTAAPEGSSVVCPYLTVDSIEQQMEFLVRVFDATIIEDAKGKEGFVQHGEVRIGDTVIMLGRAGKDYPARQSVNYVYVHNADEVFLKALQYGASAIMEPTTGFTGSAMAVLLIHTETNGGRGRLLNNSARKNYLKEQQPINDLHTNIPATGFIVS